MDFRYGVPEERKLPFLKKWVFKRGFQIFDSILTNHSFLGFP